MNETDVTNAGCMINNYLDCSTPFLFESILTKLFSLNFIVSSVQKNSNFRRVGAKTLPLFQFRRDLSKRLE